VYCVRWWMPSHSLSLVDDRGRERFEYVLFEFGVLDVEFSGFGDLVNRLISGRERVICVTFGMAACFANLFCLCMQTPLIFAASLNLSAIRSLGLTSFIGERKCNEAEELKTPLAKAGSFLHAYAGRLTGVSFVMWGGSPELDDLAFLLRSLALAVVLPRRLFAEPGRSSPSTFDGVLLREVFRE